MNAGTTFKSLFLVLFISLSSFSNTERSSILKRDYDTVKSEVNSTRKKFKELYDSAGTEREKKKILDDAGKYLLRSLTDTIFPYWYGTEWDFNGYSDKPGEGKIACGYFVSTTLRHCGFNVNRYKLAQQHSFSIVKTLNSGDSLISHRGINASDFIKKTQNKIKDGLYVVGLDYHVGFLLYQKGECFFIHSSYRDPVAVIKENASESLALKDSTVFIIAAITSNEKLLTKWLSSEEIRIH